MNKPVRSKKLKPAKSEIFAWRLRLYLADDTTESMAAFTNLERVCEEHLPGRYRIEVIDRTKTPQPAPADQILTMTTVARNRPKPALQVVDKLTKVEQIVVGLDLHYQDADPFGELEEEKNV